MMLKDEKKVSAIAGLLLLTVLGCDRINTWWPGAQGPVVVLRSETQMKDPCWLITPNQSAQLFFLQADSIGQKYSLHRLKSGQAVPLQGLDLPWAVESYSILPLKNGIVFLALSVRLPAGQGTRVFTAQSYDWGRSFDPPVPLRLGGGQTLKMSGPAVCGADAQLLLPLIGSDSLHVKRPILAQSLNGGRSWTPMEMAASEAVFSAGALYANHHGGMHCLLEHRADGLIHIAAYDSLTEAWGSPRSIGLPGLMPRVASWGGQLVLCFYHPHSGGLVMAHSFDGGVIWNRPKIAVTDVDSSGFALAEMQGSLKLAFTRHNGSEMLTLESALPRSQKIKGITAKIQGGRVHLRWNCVESAVYYRIFQSTPALPWTPVSTRIDNHFETVAPDSGRVLSFRVVAVETLGEPTGAAMAAVSDSVGVIGRSDQ